MPPKGLLVLSVFPFVLLAAPLTSLGWRAFSPAQLGAALRDPVVLQALWLSLQTTSVSLAAILAIGTPVAYLLARYRFAGREAFDTLLALPMVMPPAVAGLAMLMAFGRMGTIGQFLAPMGVALAFSKTAVVMAQCFVAMPFYIRAARTGFEGVERDLELAAATLGAKPMTVFWRVTLPLAAPALLAGAVTAWARALGEFGATLMFAGNFSGRTQTMPLAIYSALESDLGSALTLALVLLSASFAALLLVRLITARGRS